MLFPFSIENSSSGIVLLLLMQKIAVIVPCYNESRRIRPEEFISFMQTHSNVALIFVNDGSKDDTLSILEKINNACFSQVHIINLEKNKGKANAIRTGLLHCAVDAELSHVGYLDADLSTSLQEFYALREAMKNENLDFVLGSRIKLMQATIKRSFSRHIIGRFIATVIDMKFRLGIYDTQCGAKWFRRELISELIKEPFKTKWFFDVELFLRIKNIFPLANGKEIPLSHWSDPGKSRLNVLHFPAILADLFSLMRNYPSRK